MGRRSWIKGIKIGFTIIGTTIGAGFASGREIWEFFGSHGEASQIGIILSMILFGICNVIILQLSWQYQTDNYLQMIQGLMGKTVARVFDFFMIFYLGAVVIVMFAASGAILYDWHIPYTAGAIICGLLVFIVVIRGGDGVLAINLWIMPILIVCLFLIAFNYIKITPRETGGLGIGKTAWASAIVYTSYNVPPLIAVLSSFGKRIRNRFEIYLAVLVAITGLSLVALTLNGALLRGVKVIGHFELPLFAFLQSWPPGVTIIVTILLWLAIYTTAIIAVYGVALRIMEHFSIPLWQIALIILVLVIPFSQFGFGKLVSFLYPLFGVLNLFIVGLIVLYPLRSKNS